MELNTTFYLTVVLAIIFYIVVKRKSSAVGPNGAKYHPIDADSVKEWLDEREEFFFVDVRSPSEYSSKHIKGAQNIPVSNLKNVADATFKDKENFIVVYCQSGSRSRQAANTLIKMGYTEVYDLGSINNWPYKKTK